MDEETFKSMKLKMLVLHGLADNLKQDATILRRQVNSVNHSLQIYEKTLMELKQEIQEIEDLLKKEKREDGNL
jgi:chromosome segregation ATPase